ncbi:hypothetical protein BDW74DRAFT_181457 [Aspergillus multicolor]|uniref:uncharacterized protein n=1 Tax=Aspergillus multicolor TaxID=41759 RepID=UPI003CCDE6BB
MCTSAPPPPPPPTPKPLAFLGASTGCGLTALTPAIQTGTTCLALCRTPSKLATLAAKYPATLIIKAGNAHNAKDILSILTHSGSPVSAISFSIGNKPDFSAAARESADPNVCEKGMRALLEALATMRSSGFSGWYPLLSVVSTTGISDSGRDIPLLLYPLYHVLLAVPHADKRVMESLLRDSGERFVLVRPSLLVDGKGEGDGKRVRVGLEDVRSGRVVRREVGWTISRKTVGEWMFGNLLSRADPELEVKVEGMAVSLTW